jgi:universal stress protein A
MVPKNVLVATDFSDCAEYALDYACEIAADLGATVHLVNALGAMLPELSIALSDHMIETMRVEHFAALEQLAAAHRARVPIGRIIVEAGDARDAILAAARVVSADLIVMGTHGRRGIPRVLLGSVAEAVLRRSPCPVLTVRHAKGAPS